MFIFETWNSVILCGGYYGYYRGFRVVLQDRFLVVAYIGAFLLEALFLSLGVLLGRRLHKDENNTLIEDEKQDTTN